ncbi:hypothetical protein [Catenulispora yoronensis]|uniref:hypothetical protein n=1 Tax=Catenulispora yoronensis TaxID=450799 RepID=UPI0031DDEA07
MLDGLNARIINRWLGQACLNGLPFVALLMVAHALGQGHAFDTRLLAHRADVLWASWHHTAAETAVLVTVILAVAAIADLLAEALGAEVAAMWLGKPPWLLRVIRRQAPQRHRPEAADAAGYRLQLTETRVTNQYGLHLGIVWPRIWLLTTDTARGEVQKAWDGYQAAATRFVWGLACLAVGCVWWPAAVAGAAVAISARQRGRHDIRIFCELVESVVDTTVKRLAETVGIATPHGQVTQDLGPLMEDVLAKGAAYPLP